MLYFFDTCRDAIRTIPTLQHDPHKVEDVDCWVAGTMISTPSGDRAIELIEGGDLVDTPLGPKPVLRSYLSGASETVRVELSNGQVLEGTPEHKIYVRGKGLIALNNLECHDVLIERNTSWLSRLLSTTASHIGAMKGGYIITPMARSLLLEAHRFIARCGLILDARSLPAITFITSTEITTTTISPILNAFTPAIMPDTTSARGWIRSKPNSTNGEQPTRVSGRSGQTLSRCELARQSGNYRAGIVASLLSLDMVQSCFARGNAAISRVAGRFTSVAKYVGRSFSPSATTPKKSAPVRIVAVGRSDERVNVYNITVADAHLFYANGVLSSNTDMEDHAGDSCRYACMSRPYNPPVPKPPPGPRFLEQMTADEVFFPNKQQQKPRARV
jgi:hypothetical protein